ncbi:LD-carboxypeptidase [Ornithinibacillus massiliensis]|uniref:LD-carboxypeptidase n=1 Tax=Ornithinibacillus massiliensis TaxID=1944633 RepID=A0ABS5MEQ9_9BACI|nr:S66 peptidase family protein [Ornithinibacillus massiliensis]MBS3680645.1 LD-carboxypeptidase [Ornithinibacillus massiliensis]
MVIKPKKLHKGDKIATVSLSWGGAGDQDIAWRYEQGAKRLEEIFGLEVVPMPNSLKGSQYIYENPEARAEDLMTAFQDKEIKGIISNIGGDDSIRLLPYIDFELINQNPKIFMGFSDSTVTHLFCYKAGISSFYGPAILTDFAENVEMHPYTIEMVQRTLFSSAPIGEILPPPEWTSEFVAWEEGNKERKRKMHPNSGYEVIQGEGVVQGRLIGGCVEVLEFAKGTSIWPGLDNFDNSILFLETSEEKPHPNLLRYWLRNYGAQGILASINGMIIAKPKDEKFYKEYQEVIQTVLKEYNREDLPVLYNLSFGHTEPRFILPYGAMAEIDCERARFSIVENVVE